MMFGLRLLSPCCLSIIWINNELDTSVSKGNCRLEGRFFSRFFCSLSWCSCCLFLFATMVPCCGFQGLFLFAVMVLLLSLSVRSHGAPAVSFCSLSWCSCCLFLFAAMVLLLSLSVRHHGVCCGFQSLFLFAAMVPLQCITGPLSVNHHCVPTVVPVSLSVHHHGIPSVGSRVSFCSPLCCPSNRYQGPFLFSTMVSLQSVKGSLSLRLLDAPLVGTRASSDGSTARLVQQPPSSAEVKKESSLTHQLLHPLQ